MLMSAEVFAAPSYAARSRAAMNDIRASAGLGAAIKGFDLLDFETLGLSPALNEALSRAGFSKPTPIQNQAIPLALDGHDILGLAQTGTGKTLAFGLPLIEQLLATPGRPAPKTA